VSWSVLQSNSNTVTAASNTWTLSYTTANLTAGTVLLFAVGQSGAGTINSVQDGALNNFSLIKVVNLGNNNSHGECALYAVATPSGDVGTKPTITIKFSSSVVGSLWIAEVSGIQVTTDGSAASAFGSAGACTPSYSDTASGEFFVTVFADDGGPETSSVTGGWSVDNKSVNNNADANVVVAYGNSAGGAETNAWTSTGSTTFCGAVSVAFQPAASAPAVALPVLRTPATQALVTPPVEPVLFPPPGNLAPAFTETGSGSDAAAVNVSLTDSGAGSDSLNVLPWLRQPLVTPPSRPLSSAAAPPALMQPQAVPTALPDAGSGSDALSVVTPLADSGSGTDTQANTVALLDAGAGSDALAAVLTSFLPGLITAPRGSTPPIAGPAPLIQPLAAVPPGTPSLPDAGAGSDTLFVAAAAGLSETGTGADTLSVALTGQISALILSPMRPAAAAPAIPPQLLSPGVAVALPVSLTDSGAGSDTIVVSVQSADSGSGADSASTAVTLADAGSAAESAAAAAVFAETAAGADSAAVVVAFTQPGAGADVLSVTAQSLTLTDAGSGFDVVVLSTAATDSGHGADALALPPPGVTGTVSWRVGKMPPRWRAVPQQPRWAAKAAGPRWRVALMDRFTPIAAISLQEVNVLWTSDLAGTSINPTTAPLAVQMAFPISSGVPAMPAQPVTWYTASWLTGTTIKGYVAQCLVGPGGVVTLTSGQSYDVWSKIQGSPEIPALFAGVQQVY